MLNVVAATFISRKLSSFFQRYAIACSRTSVQNAFRYGQCETYNCIIWSADKIAMRSRKLEIQKWELVLLVEFEFIHSFLSIVTNHTPYELFFNYIYQQKMSFGIFLCFDF